MFKEMKSRRLALLVAVALGGGGFLSSAQNVSAADVTENNVEIDGTGAHEPLNNVFEPGGGPSIGTAAGYVGGEGDISNVTGNTLTYRGHSLPYDKALFGGITFGIGNVTGNKVFVNSTTVPLTSSVEAVHGGKANGGGSVEDNHVKFNGDNLNGDLVGGTTNRTGIGVVKGNTAMLKGGSVHGNIYGGMASGGSNGDVVENTATIEAGTATGSGKSVYGGYTDGAGKVESNKVVIKNGTVRTVYGGKSVSGNVTKNIVEIKGGAVNQSIYGGEAGGSGKAEENIVTLTSGTASGDIFGGVASSGAATGNKVNINGGSAANHDVYGGFSTNGDATGNTVTVTAGSVRNIDGGRSLGGNATGNTVNIGSTDAAFAGSITGIINGGSGTTYGNDYRTGNKLNVYGNATATNIKNFAELNFHFNAHVTQTTPFLTLSDADGTTIQSLGDINVDGEHGRKGTLLKNTHGVTITDAQRRLVKTTGNKELVLAKSSDNKSIDYEGYAFAHQTAPTTLTDGGTTSTWGGRSIAGNSTHDNAIAVESGTHTNVYGGWTSGTGSTAADKNNSYKNKVTVKGSATVSGNVYGGYTDVAGGTATGNEVTIEKSITGAVVGGKALGEASGNTVTVKANTGAVTGGEGATTNNNTVNLHGATVSGAVTGGTQASGTGNTLNVKGMNTAQSVAGFQKMTFDTTGVAASGIMLNVTGGGQTKVDWNTLTAGGNGRNITLMRNNNGIDFSSTYTAGAVKSGLSVDKKSETNVSVSSDQKEIKYTGYQFTGVTTTTNDGGNLYGGVSKAGNATHHNEITVNGSYTNVYGGHTSGTSNTDVEKKDSHDNTVTITGGTITGKVYGGYTDVDGGTTENNKVNLGDGTNALAAGTNLSNAELYGGNKSAKGNTLNVNTAATVGKIENFSTVAFKNASSKLTLTGGVSNFDLDAIEANFGATANPTLLVENTSGLTLKDGKAFRSELSTDGTKETNIEARAGNTKIVRYGYTIKGATSPTTLGTEMWGGRSAAGNTTTGNAIAVADATGKTVYGGYTSGTGTSATGADAGDSHTNTVNVAGGVYTAVYGGRTDVAGGKAVSNTVNVTQDAQGSIVGGYSASGEASNNVVDVTGHTFTGNITGGQGSVTNYNVIRLRNAAVTGTVTGGTAANGKDNTLAVSYGSGTSSSVKDFSGIQNLHFDMETAPVNNTNPLLKLTAVTGGDKNLTGMKFVVARSGATQKLAKGDTFTLMENTTGGGHNITVGSGVTAEGIDGVSRRYTFDITQDPHDAHKLIATVTKAGMGEQSKSIVETRAGASAFLNDGADFLAGAGMDAAGKEARAAAQNGSAPYGLWAGMGGGSFRHETGSYVDMKGWNLGVGWARENAVQAGTLTFGPFIEYGRGSYDSYLDDGTHGSGKTNYLGAGMMAKLETGSHWADSSLRIGRTKSDYTGLANYDTTSTYYGVQVGIGKDFHVRENDTVGAYVRYAYAHTAGTSAHLSSGETFDFDAVNSHRLRVGTRYTHGATALSQFYAGLAWEYEFDGDARATSQGDSAPSPSLKGGSALLELGYRFAPQGSRMSYDLNLNGWQGKRKGVTGGVSVKWAF